MSGYVLFFSFFVVTTFASDKDITTLPKYGIALNPISVINMFPKMLGAKKVEGDGDWEFVSMSVSYFDYADYQEFTIPFVYDSAKSSFEPDTLAAYFDLEDKFYFSDDLHGFYIGIFFRAGETIRSDYVAYENEQLIKKDFMGVGLSVGYRYTLELFSDTLMVTTHLPTKKVDFSSNKP